MAREPDEDEKEEREIDNSTQGGVAELFGNEEKQETFNYSLIVCSFTAPTMRFSKYLNLSKVFRRNTDMEDADTPEPNPICLKSWKTPLQF